MIHLHIGRIGSDPHDVRRALRFLTRNLLLVGVVALAGTPIYFAALHATRENVLQESYNSFRSGVSHVNGTLENLAALSDTISAEPSVEHLAQIQGEMSIPDYTYLLSAQQFMSQTLVSDPLVKNAYCLFPGNRIFLSRTMSDPDWGSIYGSFMTVSGVSGDDWYKTVSGAHSRVSILYQARSNWVFSPTEALAPQNTIQIAVPPVAPGRLQADAVPVYILDASEFFASFGSDKLMQNSFLYVADAEGNPVIRKNYAGGALRLTKDIQQVKVRGTRYTVLQIRSEFMGFHFVMGVPESYFAQEMKPLRNVIMLYVLLFSLVALAAASGMAALQYTPFKRLMESLKDVLNEPADSRSEKNEYGYITEAVHSLDSKSRYYESELSFLSASLYNNMLDRLLSGKILTKQDEEKSVALFGFTSRRFCVCAMRFGTEAAAGGVDETMRVNALIQEEIARQLACPAYFYNAEFQSGYVLFNLPEDWPKDRDRIAGCMETASRFVRESLGTFMVCGIGSICEGLRQIYLSAGQARDALWLSGEQTPVCVWAERRETDGGMLMDNRFARRLEEILAVGDTQYVEEYFARLDGQLANTTALTEPQICQAFYTMRNTLESVVCKQCGGFAVSLPAYSRRLGARELFRQFYTPSLEVCRYTQECHAKKDDSQRRQILDFIHQNYGDCDLCAQTIADRFFVSEKYVFTLVKSMTDRSLGEYLEQLRFARVEELLRGDVEISEIPRQVGYRSVNTFYKSFKRRYGVAPGKWREQVQSSDGAALPDHP